MSTATLEHYLTHSYEPDCDYVDGSIEDRMSRLEVRIQDYLAMGVPYVWVLDPATRQAYVSTAADGLREVKDGVLRASDPTLEMPLGGLWG